MQSLFRTSHPLQLSRLSRLRPVALLVTVAGAIAAMLLVAFGPLGTAHADTDGHPHSSAEGRLHLPQERFVPDPHPKTIVRVTGDQSNGFSIFYFDGTSDHPPTDSEARAECNEYDDRVARVACRVKVRTWYFGLADLRDSIRHYKALLRAAR